MGINIGDNNKIANSNFISDSSLKENNQKGFWEKHSFLLAVISGLLVSVIMLFSFWENIVDSIENLFK